MIKVADKNGKLASKTEMLRMLSSKIVLKRVVDFWRNPVEKTLYVMLDHTTDGELILI
jgi:hypothetical protein